MHRGAPSEAAGEEESVMATLQPDEDIHGGSAASPLVSREMHKLVDGLHQALIRLIPSIALNVARQAPILISYLRSYYSYRPALLQA